MNEVKENLICRSAENFKKLPHEKQIFVLGIMQGILISQPDKTQVSSKELCGSRAEGSLKNDRFGFGA